MSTPTFLPVLVHPITNPLDARRHPTQANFPPTHLVFLLLTGHHQNFAGGVDDLELANDGGRVGSYKELVEVVDDHLVAAIGTYGRKEARLGQEEERARVEASAPNEL